MSFHEAQLPDAFRPLSSLPDEREEVRDDGLYGANGRHSSGTGNPRSHKVCVLPIAVRVWVQCVQTFRLETFLQLNRSSDGRQTAADTESSNYE